jgi:hypothetical protein
VNRVICAVVGALLGLVVAGCGSTTVKTVIVESPPSSTATTSTATAASSTAATTTATQATTTTSSSTPPTTTAPAPVVHLTTFESPSRNIGCVVLDGTARCDINHRDWSPPPRPAKCPDEVDFGQGLQVFGPGPGTFVCAGDTAMDPSAAVLRYGSDSVDGKFSCASATTGITCTDTVTGHGFFISIQSYRVF